jgi:ribosomal protein S18 acetylase RimI-like enzyme
MTLRTLSREDLPAVAAVHRAAFPRMVVSRIGAEAVRRYYESLLSGPYETAGLGAFEEGRLAGFCFVGVRHWSEGVFVREHAAFIVWRLLASPRLWVDPVVLRRLEPGLRLLFTRPPRMRETEAGNCETEPPSYGIQLIAVEPGWQGAGVGRRLMEAGEAHARRRGSARIELSVEPSNVRAVGFYERLGWRKLAAGGEWNGLMEKSLR